MSVKSQLSAYLARSAQVLRTNAIKVVRMEGANEPNRKPITLFTLNSHHDLSQFSKGCDADIGGTSTVNLTLEQSSPTEKRFAKFWGEMHLGVRPEVQGLVRGGYAGFWSKRRTTLFGDILDDLSHHKYLALRVRSGGNPRTRNSYFVNIKTDSAFSSDLWQHRLFFRKDQGQWEDVFIPLEDFVLRNTGENVQARIRMNKERVKTVGISFLGGHSGIEGQYELGIDSIRAVNEEDADVPEKDPSEGTRWKRDRTAL
ncbi:complex I intermediate-associated protein CIA30 [Thelephora terrestris]|uniref:Complex I intermediate-associated protein CIA30 n=1 Tax=Thelephora terrestris TaxID=56493 RepID=A0A9P6HM66_9AGAM|nr:complex I intermediate-associated protein CIA30 [Thelephora terrestris]